MNANVRLAAAIASISITAVLLLTVFSIAADAPDSQVVREAIARQTAPVAVAHRAAPAPLPQFADASRFIR